MHDTEAFTAGTFCRQATSLTKSKVLFSRLRYTLLVVFSIFKYSLELVLLRNDVL